MCHSTVKLSTINMQRAQVHRKSKQRVCRGGRTVDKPPTRVTPSKPLKTLESLKLMDLRAFSNN